MTELLFMKDCYLKEFDAKVLENNDNSVVLDRTCFYPTSGGQLYDKGKLNNIDVIDVRREEGKIKHFLKEKLNAIKVHGVIDWNRRYKHMRMHTAQHLLSAIVLDKYNAETVGNQINTEKSRIDFYPLKVDQDMIKFLTGEFNKFVDDKGDVKIYITSRDDVIKNIDERRRKLFSRVPSSIKEVRVVEINGLDKCPCAGTHISNTAEIKYINVVKTDNKGKNITRIIFELED